MRLATPRGWLTLTCCCRRLGDHRSDVDQCERLSGHRHRRLFHWSSINETPLQCQDRRHPRPRQRRPRHLRRWSAGADVFRLNFSHGTHADHKQRLDLIRRSSPTSAGRSACCWTCRARSCASAPSPNGPVQLVAGRAFRLDLDRTTPGDAERAPLPHPEIFAALEPGDRTAARRRLLRLRVSAGRTSPRPRSSTAACCRERKGVNVPGVGAAALGHDGERRGRPGVRPGPGRGLDRPVLRAARRGHPRGQGASIAGPRRAPWPRSRSRRRLSRLPAILEAADAVMVARGDLGVELPAEQVPAMQKRIVARVPPAPGSRWSRHADAGVDDRRAGPTRAEARDVANAILDGADAVMLSAETASGKYPARRWRRWPDDRRGGGGGGPGLPRRIERTWDVARHASVAEAIGCGGASVGGSCRWRGSSPTPARERRACAWPACGPRARSSASPRDADGAPDRPPVGRDPGACEPRRRRSGPTWPPARVESAVKLRLRASRRRPWSSAPAALRHHRAPPTAAHRADVARQRRTYGKHQQVRGYEILDSRGNPTVAVEVDAV